jgi:hypothetical protein
MSRKKREGDGAQRVGAWFGAGAACITAAIWGAHGWHWAAGFAGVSMLCVAWAVAIVESER